MQSDIWGTTLRLTERGLGESDTRVLLVDMFSHFAPTTLMQPIKSDVAELDHVFKRCRMHRSCLIQIEYS